MTINFDSPVSIRTFLEAQGLAVSKKFGQNFLVDRGMRERIIEALDVQPGMSVWEIGPGIGSMTEIILQKGADLTTFEIDYGFVRVLEEMFGSDSHFSIVKGDMLKTWRSVPERPDRIFGNLPYSAAFAIIADLLEQDCVPARMVFTLQKEAARRMAARPGTKDYSSLSVLCASVCDVRILFDIGASAFWPQPRVTSSVVLLVPKKDPVAPEKRKDFSDFVRAAFSSRRKTLRNALHVWAHTHIPSMNETEFESLLAACLAKIGARPDVRAEALPPRQLWDLYDLLSSASTGIGACTTPAPTPAAAQPSLIASC
jgi:dimethyladenosine transferase